MIRRRLELKGLVQGVGFRPFVAKVAEQFRCSGWVRNTSSGLLLELQGPAQAVASAMAMIEHSPPPLAVIHSVQQTACEPLDAGNDFRILASDSSSHALALISPDVATCADCLRELRDPGNRRYQYPFINCTNCGPRFTIQQAVPYDRRWTTMSSFTMCQLCQAEYDSPVDRRFHAQPNACPQCGPVAWFVQSAPGEDPSYNQLCSMRSQTAELIDSAVAIQSARSAIAAGMIVAIKGIGGFHLACDARQPTAVQRLRLRKQRPFKPLAVMVADIRTAESLVHLAETERELLGSVQRPIVLMRKRADLPIAQEVAPTCPHLGVMLPYSPVHHLLLQPGDVWVMTSGNLADEPIAFDNQDAIQRLSEVADAFLLHDRPIHAVCDDSVMRVSATGIIPIRRSRGYAPLPVALQDNGPSVLAIGSELKTAICLATGANAFMGQHVGDMGNRQTLLATERSCDHLCALYASAPEVIAADQHPGYMSSQFATQQATQRGLPLIQVQHHHAHAAALMAEHGLAEDQPMIACVFDGTGYGSDGAIWGGEVMIAHRASFQRVAHLQTIPLPGGDQCILKPARAALAHLHAAHLSWSESLPCVQWFTSSERNILRQQLDRKIYTVPTSSMGRLFDAVASLLDVRHEIDYEGQAAEELEFLAESVADCLSDDAIYKGQWTDGQSSQLRTAPLLEQLCAEIASGKDRASIAYKFHCTIARAFAEQCVSIRAAASGRTLNYVGLTGGVFQNALLLKLMQGALVELGFEVLLHKVVPPNDGGLALGQAVVARATKHVATSNSGLGH